jgi:hypothetical protein
MSNDVNTGSEFIPEGLEFKEEYMVSAFDLYDQAMQKKKKRRFFIILFVFSAIGLSLLPLLIDNRLDLDEFVYKSTVNVDSLNKKRRSTETAVGGKTEGEKTEVTGKLASSQETLSTSANTKGISRQSKARPLAPEGTDFTSVVEQDADDKPTTGSEMQTLAETGKGDSTHPENESPVSTFEGIASLTPRSNSAPLHFNTALDSNELEIDHSFHSLGIRRRDYAKNAIVVGLGFNTLFSLQDNKKPYLMKESITLGYQRRFSSRFSANLNAEYYSTNRVDLSDPADLSNDFSILSGIPLTYFVFSTGANWRLNPKNELTFTLGMDHASTNFYSYFRNAEEKSSYLEASEKLRKNNYFVSLGYRYSLSSVTSVYVNYKYGFHDAIINFADKNFFDRNSRLQVVMEFKLKQW